MGETSSSQTVSTKLERIAQLAKNAPEMVFTTLHSSVDQRSTALMLKILLVGHATRVIGAGDVRVLRKCRFQLDHNLGALRT